MESHGEYKMTVNGVLELKAISTWNEITTKKFTENLKILAKKLEESPWGLLIHTIDWGLAPQNPK